MSVDLFLDVYAKGLKLMERCFGERGRLMDLYAKSVTSGDLERTKALAEELEAVHQVQHKAFELLGIISRHFLHVLDIDNAIQIFNHLNDEEIDPVDRKKTAGVLRRVVEKGEHTPLRSKKWILEETEAMASEDYPHADLMGTVMGGVMLILSENFNHVVEMHKDLSDKMISLIDRARKAFPNEKISPGDYISKLNPAEAKRDAIEVLREYTEKFIDPDSYKAYQ